MIASIKLNANKHAETKINNQILYDLGSSELINKNGKVKIAANHIRAVVRVIGLCLDLEIYLLITCENPTNKPARESQIT